MCVLRKIKKCTDQTCSTPLRAESQICYSKAFITVGYLNKECEDDTCDIDGIRVCMNDVWIERNAPAKLHMIHLLKGLYDERFDKL